MLPGISVDMFPGHPESGAEGEVHHGEAGSSRDGAWTAQGPNMLSCISVDMSLGMDTTPEDETKSEDGNTQPKRAAPR